MRLDQIWFMEMMRVVTLLTDRIFFDTDCLSAFLWVNNQSILAQLYSSQIIISMQVYNELSYPTTPHLKMRMDAMVSNGDARLESFAVGSEEYKLYMKLTTDPDKGFHVIGAGEAAGIAMAKERNGILASNNISDIQQYVELYDIKHITTGNILKEALGRKLITQTQGDQIWSDMLKKKRQLGYSSFSDFLLHNQD